MVTVTFHPLQSWVACVRAGYIYKIDYPVYDVNDPARMQYGALRYRMFEMEMIDLGRFDEYDVAVQACQEHADHDHGHVHHVHDHVHAHDHVH